MKYIQLIYSFKGDKDCTGCGVLSYESSAATIYGNFPLWQFSQGTVVVFERAEWEGIAEWSRFSLLIQSAAESEAECRKA